MWYKNKPNDTECLQNVKSLLSTFRVPITEIEYENYVAK